MLVCRDSSSFSFNCFDIKKSAEEVNITFIFIAYLA
jgi:hypothetical protein